MVRLQESGVYPSAFASITCPAVMLHGSYDPHPGKLIRDSLAPYIPRLEYHEFERCGHEPWVERYARDEFLSVLRTTAGRTRSQKLKRGWAANPDEFAA